MADVNQDVNVPKEVLEAADLAEQLHAKLYPAETPAQDSVTTPTEPAQEPATPQEPVQEPVVDEEEKYEARYKTLQGMHNALAQEMKTLKAQLAQAQPQAAVVEPPKPSPIDERIGKLREEYGEELVEDWKALIAAEIAQATKPVQDKVQQLEDTTKEVQKNEFAVQLTKLSTGWEDKWDSVVQVINDEVPNNPKFIQFLEQTDPNGFYTYGEILMQANENRDVNKMAKVFNLFDSSVAQQQVAPPVVPPQAPQSQQAIVAPSRSTVQPTPAANDAKIWTMAEFNQFQVDDRMGKFDAATSEALWNDALAAVSQGRMRQ